MRFYSHFAVWTAMAFLLTACAGNKVPDYKAPTMNGTWKDIGRIHQNNIVVSYETSSVRKVGETGYLRGRKIVIDPRKEAYEDTPRYKIAVGDWEFHCKNRTYRLASLQFLDERGVLIKQVDFTPTQIRHMPLTSNTISEKQFKIACK